MLSITALTSLFAVLEAKLLQTEGGKVKLENSVAGLDHYDAEHAWVRAGRQLTATDLKNLSEERKRRLEGDAISHASMDVALTNEQIMARLNELVGETVRDEQLILALVELTQKKGIDIDDALQAEIDQVLGLTTSSTTNSTTSSQSSPSSRRLEEDGVTEAPADAEVFHTDVMELMAVIANQGTTQDHNNQLEKEFEDLSPTGEDMARRQLLEEFGMLPGQQEKEPVMEELRLHPTDPLEVFRSQGSTSEARMLSDSKDLDDGLDQDDTDFIDRQLAETNRAMNMWKNLEGSNSVPVNGDELRELSENRRRLAEATEFSDLVDDKPKKRSLMDREPVAAGPQQPHWFGAALQKMF